MDSLQTGHPPPLGDVGHGSYLELAPGLWDSKEAGMSGYQALGHPGTSGSCGRAVNGVLPLSLPLRLDLAWGQGGKAGALSGPEVGGGESLA